MSGHADAVMFCLIAAALVVVAHGIDAVSSRRRSGDGWGNSLALALCGLGLGLVCLGAVMATSRTDLLLTLSTAAAVVVSAMPLVGLNAGDEDAPPANPWDRAFRVRRGRVTQLLSPTPRPAPPQSPAPRTAPPAGVPEAAREGVVMPTGMPGPERTAAEVVTQRRRPAPSDPEVYEAEETLHDVTEVVGDLGRLLGLDRRDGRRP